MLYPSINFNYKKRLQWVIQKNIEAEEKWAQKKEELEKRTKRNNFLYKI
tara:strand:- start:452 stop:598 length:147 start_codon:yes stop_codon:yes gene_type:complete